MASFCGKGLLYFYNLIFVGISAVIMYISVLFVKNWGDYSTLAARTYTIVPAGIIFLFGILFFITGVVGFCGTCKENRCTLGVFFVLLAILLALELVAGSLTYKKKDIIEESLKKNLWHAFKTYSDPDMSSSKRSFDKMQEQLECCGVDKPSDWLNFTQKIPQTCCKHRNEEDCSKLPNNIYTDGCYKALLKSFYDNLRIIFGVLLAFAVLQLFGLILAVSVLIVLKRMGYTRLSVIPKC